MHEINPNIPEIEERIGVSLAELRNMAAELCGADYDPQLLHPEQLLHGIDSLEIKDLRQPDITAIIAQHSSEQGQFKSLFDLPFCTQERDVSSRILDTMMPLKHPDQYATNDMVLGEFSGKAEKDIALSVLGRLGTRSVLEVGIRHARKRRGNFHYAKWPTPQQRRDYRDAPVKILNLLKEPFALNSNHLGE